MNGYFYLKAFHIIFIVTWFAGLFYIVRLFVYHREAQELREKAQANNSSAEILKANILIEQYQIMEKRLWLGITWPSAIVTLILGLCLSFYLWPWTDHPWFLSKVGFLFGLFGYHWSCHQIYQKFQKDLSVGTSFKFRIFNEIATLFLFAIVLLVVLKDLTSFASTLGILILVSILLAFGIRSYRKFRL